MKKSLQFKTPFRIRRTGYLKLIDVEKLRVIVHLHVWCLVVFDGKFSARELLSHKFKNFTGRQAGFTPVASCVWSAGDVSTLCVMRRP